MAKKVRHFGYFVRAKRMGLGLTQKDFARQIGLKDPRQLTRLERHFDTPDQASDMMLNRIARQFGMTVPDLRVASMNTAVEVPRFREGPTRKSRPRIAASLLHELAEMAAAQNMTLDQWLRGQMAREAPERSRHQSSGAKADCVRQPRSINQPIQPPEQSVPK